MEYRKNYINLLIQIFILLIYFYILFTIINISGYFSLYFINIIIIFLIIQDIHMWNDYFSAIWNEYNIHDKVDDLFIPLI